MDCSKEARNSRAPSANEQEPWEAEHAGGPSKPTLQQYIEHLQLTNAHLVRDAIHAEALTDQMRRAQQQLSHLAHYDFLTDLPNRMLLMERLAQATAQAQRKRQRMALLFIDLDRFKQVNDTLGHAMGDLLLQLAARRVRTLVRGTDTASRTGGDEFVVLLTDVRDESDVAAFANKMARALSAPYQLDVDSACIGVTIGISMFPDDSDDGERLLRLADMAMYHGKRRGRNLCCFYRPEMNTRAIERHQTRADLQRALALGEFELYYQPRVSLTSGTIVAAEALLRWHHPLHGVIAPPRFIATAKESGMIIPIGHWALREACLQAKRWADDGLELGPVAINISPIEFHHRDFCRNLRSTLEQSGLPPHRLELEISETTLVDDSDTSNAILTELKNAGVILTLDDFGAGHSNLRHLHRSPINALKIDLTLMRFIGDVADDGVVIGAAIALGTSLGRRIVAKGVEQEAQLHFLKKRLCDEGQGMLFSPPLPAPDFAALLIQERGPNTKASKTMPLP